MIARLSLLLCKNFNLAHYSKSIKATKLGVLVHLDKVLLQDKGYNSESYILDLELCPLLTKHFK